VSTQALALGSLHCTTCVQIYAGDNTHAHDGVCAYAVSGLSDLEFTSRCY